MAGDSCMVTGAATGWLQDRIGSTGSISIEVDDDWLRSGSSAAKVGSPRRREAGEIDSADDTTSTGTFASPDQSSTSPYSPPDTTRLSGLFQGWLEANQRPAPRPSQASLVSNASQASKTKVLRALHQDALFSTDGLNSRIEFFTHPNAVEQAAGPAGRQVQPPSPSTARLTGDSQVDLRPDPSPCPSSPSPTSGMILGRPLPQAKGALSPDPGFGTQTGARGWRTRVPLGVFRGWGGGSTSGDSEADPASLGYAGASLRDASERYTPRLSSGGLWAWWTGGTKASEGSPEALVAPLRDLSVLISGPHVTIMTKLKSQTETVQQSRQTSPGPTGGLVHCAYILDR